MSLFSNDYLTTASAYQSSGYQCIQGGMYYGAASPLSEDGYCSANGSSVVTERQTSSPADSGMESDRSPGNTKTAEREDRDLAEVLADLEKKTSHVARGEADFKPNHSYIALISMAIMSTSDQKMLLSDIYQYIMDNFEFYNNEEKPWRNSIRHNLSLNECFIKAGRSDNGKGNYWMIHPACVEDFAKGDFRRRQARRRARKSTKDVNESVAARSPYDYNGGYLHMASSYNAYHPYSHQASMYYPMTSSISNSTSQNDHDNYLAANYLSDISGSNNSTTQQFYAEQTMLTSGQHMSVADNQHLAEHSAGAAVTVQALAQQQAAIASTLQFQNWLQSSITRNSQ
ncbi:FOXL1-like protein [Mya arenaria]|uniref:FOXL1-like protein n=1 Tax=Mya arenaria TaxID=6604 RepID=A0ABY7DQF9_MYAAR|nr:forkhead box protein B1-like [Mya arenaria]WAQ99128.1 FOXL1-like protein [Mya arenaria]